MRKAERSAREAAARAIDPGAWVPPDTADKAARRLRARDEAAGELIRSRDVTDEERAAQVLGKMAKELADVIPQGTAATLTYMDGNEVIVRVLTPEDIYTDEYLRRRALLSN